MPNYESWLELAEVKCRVGKTEEAIAWIDDFEMALLILDGTLPCYEPYQRLEGEMPNGSLSQRVYSEMCPVIGCYSCLGHFSVQERKAYDAELAEMRRESFRLRGLCPYLAD